MTFSFTRGLLVAASLVAMSTAGCSDPTPDRQTEAASLAQPEAKPDSAFDVTYDVPQNWDRRDVVGATIFTAPEGDASVVIVNVSDAVDAKSAATTAWQRHDPSFSRPIRLNSPQVAKNGWDIIREIEYQTSPAEERLAYAYVYGAADQWTVVLLDDHPSPRETRRDGPAGLG